MVAIGIYVNLITKKLIFFYYKKYSLFLSFSSIKKSKHRIIDPQQGMTTRYEKCCFCGMPRYVEIITYYYFNGIYEELTKKQHKCKFEEIRPKIFAELEEKIKTDTNVYLYDNKKPEKIYDIYIVFGIANEAVLKLIENSEDKNKDMCSCGEILYYTFPHDNNNEIFVYNKHECPYAQMNIRFNNKNKKKGCVDLINGMCIAYYSMKKK